MEKKELPKVAIVGRPNTGKSTLFNRLISERQAIEFAEPNTTRDRLFREVIWEGKCFRIIDTGGLMENDSRPDEISSGVRQQTELAIREADLVLFLTDAQVGILPLDREIANNLRKAGKKVILVTNKVDNFKKDDIALEAYELGLGEPFPVSALHGTNTGALLDRIIALLPEAREELHEDTELFTLAIVGQPNVGKSSMLNLLSGEERALVTSIPGTTRDIVESRITVNGEKFRLLDTAGLKRGPASHDALERTMSSRTAAAVEKADLVIFMLEALRDITHYEKTIAEKLASLARALVIFVNKTDLLHEKTAAEVDIEKKVRKEFPHLSFAPVVFGSVKTGAGIEMLFSKITEIKKRTGNERIKTSLLNNLIRELVTLHPPPVRRSRQLKIKYSVMINTHPPTFLFFVNIPYLFDGSYRRYIEKRLRYHFDFEGLPLRFIVKKRERD